MESTDQRSPKSSSVRVTVLVVLLIAAITGGLVYHLNGRAPDEKFCTMGLGIATVQGRTVVDQDQGGPGKDGCDLPDHGQYTDVGPTLGFDCKIRAGSGEVIDSLPRADDGSCDVNG